MGKLPAVQFYPGDWRKDVGVQSLSFHDRGVWFEILMLMHESEDRGVLTLNKKPMSDDALSRLLGLDKQILTTTITNLIDAGVASFQPETGALMNRRMVRDESVRKVRSEAGKLGGNPALLKQKPTTGDKQNPTPSSSSSSSSSIQNPPLAGEIPDPPADAPAGSPIADPPRPMTGDENMAAIWLFTELGLAHTFGDRGVMAQVVAFEARTRGDTQAAAEYLLAEAKSAMQRGEVVNVFWFKDRKFSPEQRAKAEGGSASGTNSSNRGGAVGRVERSVSEWDRAIAERRAAGAVRSTVPADAGVLPAPRVQP